MLQYIASPGNWCLWWQTSDRDGSETPVLCKVRGPHDKFKNYSEVLIPRQGADMEGSYIVERAPTCDLGPLPKELRG